MKIIQICAAYKPAYIYGGPTMSVAKLAEELVKVKQDVVVLTTTANGAEELPVKTGEAQIVDGVNVHYFKRLTKDHTHFSPALLWHLHHLLSAEKEEIPVVHIHAWWNLVSLLSCAIAHLHGAKTIVSPRGMLTQYTLGNRNGKIKKLMHRLIGKPLLAKCHIHATSLQEQHDVAAVTPYKSCTVIPNFVALPTTTVTQHRNTTQFNMLFLARIEEKKGLDILFEALAQLSIPYHLRIAGTGSESYISKLKTLATQLNINKNITWLGHVSNTEKFKLLAQQQLMVLTSANENFANVVIESLAVGTPVLVSNKVGLSNYIEDKNLGWVVNLQPTEIAASITSIYNNDSMRLSINNEAPQIIAQDFDNKTLVKAYQLGYRN